MKTLRVLIWSLLVLALLIPSTVSASSGNGDQIIFGDTYTVKSGTTAEESFYVIGGTLDIEEKSVVIGDITLVGGSANIAGEVQGDVTIIGGHVELTDKAVIKGNLTSAGGSFNQAPGAQVTGKIDLQKLPEIQQSLEAQTTAVIGEAGKAVGTAVSEATRLAISTPEPVVAPTVQPTKSPDTNGRTNLVKPVFNFFKSIISIIVDSIFLGVLAMLLALFIPNHLRRLTDTINANPLLSEGVGVLTIIAAPIILVLLTLTLILIPVTVVAVILLVAALVMGWIALGTELGIRIARAMKTTWHIAVSAGLGTLLLTLVMNTLWFIPCLGWLAAFLVGMIGLGAVILTRYGTHIYMPSSVSGDHASDQGSES